MSIANIVFSQLVLHGESQDPAAHPDWICANDPLVFSAECRNDGDRSTRSFHVTFRLDGVDQHSERVEGLSPGESQWVQYRHDAVEHGHHEIYVEFDSRERIRESDENDNNALQSFFVAGPESAGHTITFEAEEVIGSPDWAANGWAQIDVTYIVRDPRGRPIRGFNFFSRYLGPENEESYGGEDAGDSELDAAGIMRCPNVWLKSEGSLNLMAVPTAGGPHEGGPMLEGSTSYRLAPNATTMTFDVSQGQFKVEVYANSREEASRKVAAEGHAGIEIEILSLGGSVTEEEGTSHSRERGMKWEVVLGTTALTLAQTH